jgi:hypothetical protein
MWSDAARKAALEARQANAKNRAAAQGDHQAAQTAPVAPGRQPVAVRPGSATAERIAILKGVDERHFPSESDASVASKTDLGAATGRAPVTVRPAIAARLDPKINSHLNEIMRRANAPGGVVTAGQAVAAGLTGNTKG